MSGYILGIKGVGGDVSVGFRCVPCSGEWE